MTPGILNSQKNYTRKILNFVPVTERVRKLYSVNSPFIQQHCWISTYVEISACIILSVLSLVHTCRKNREFSPSGVCEWILNTLKYGTNIRLLWQRYRNHSIKSARRSYPRFLRQVHVNQALVLLLAVTQLRPGNEVVSTK